MSIKTGTDLIERHIEADTHTSISEFIRDAIRSKIERDMPDAYRTLFTDSCDIEVENIDNGGI